MSTFEHLPTKITKELEMLDWQANDDVIVKKVYTFIPIEED